MDQHEFNLQVIEELHALAEEVKRLYDDRRHDGPYDLTGLIRRLEKLRSTLPVETE